jgi:DNA-binding NarL/FixJ family response regulator
MTDPEVIRRLDVLIRLVAVAVSRQERPQKERPQKEMIALLASAGLSAREIAEFLGTTPGTVSVAVSNMRKEKGARRGARVVEPSDES